MTTERRYQMVRLATGDYLLPSNDAAKIWRLKRYREYGDAVVTDAAGRERSLVGEFWEVWRWTGEPTDVVGIAASVDENEWDRWDVYASTLRSRGQAIEAALAEGASPLAAR